MTSASASSPSAALWRPCRRLVPGLLVVLAYAACSDGSPGAPAILDAAKTEPDAAAAPDTADAADTVASPWSFAPSNVPIAALASDTDDELVISEATCGGSANVAIDVDDGTIALCPALALGTHYLFSTIAQSDGSRAGLLVSRSVRIEAGMIVSVTGKLPLVVAAMDELTIDGTLRAAPHDEVGLAGGSSGRSDSRGDGFGPGAGTAAGPGGGGGGSYCGHGGKGGSGNGAGPAYGSPRIVPLVGGSGGGNGGVWYSGAGGGAIQLIAGRRLAIGAAGVVHVGGGGGDLEGGGAGSGGALLLEAPSILVAGVLAANGGGGGSGGQFGADATADDRPAQGGAAVHLNTGEGGDGAAGAQIQGGDGRPNPTFANGEFTGGGGGGAGYIRINGRSVLLPGILSPALGSTCTTRGLLD
jgi:hypothetical protein